MKTWTVYDSKGNSTDVRAEGLYYDPEDEKSPLVFYVGSKGEGRRNVGMFKWHAWDTYVEEVA